MILRSMTKPEEVEAFRRLMEWPRSEEELRATWGEGPEAEAGQAAMMSRPR